MSESKEQFIHRITTIAAEKVNAHYEGHVLMVDLPAAAEAVYAEAWREALKIMQSSEGDIDFAEFVLRTRAAERVLTLEDEP